MRRKSLKLGFRAIFSITVVFSVTQITMSLVDLLQGQSNLVQLTYVEPENNFELQRHPLYTICPIFEQSANLSLPGQTLRTVMINNTVFYPTVLLLKLLNSPALEAKRYTTWTKMIDTVDGLRQIILVQCQTFDISNDIAIGGMESKVNFVLLGKEHTRSWPDGSTPAPTVKEYRIFIHEKTGHINTFMLNEGRPHMIVPAFSKQYLAMKSQFLLFRIKKQKVEMHKSGNCEPDPVNDCYENYLQTRLGSCIIPWKTPNQDPPCPPCFWNKSTHHGDICIDFQLSDLTGLKQCYAPNPLEEGYCSYNDMKHECFVCDDNCRSIHIDEMCIDGEALDTILDTMSLPSENSRHLESHGGCKLPCSYFKYTSEEFAGASSLVDMMPHKEIGSVISLELSTEDVETVVQISANTVLSFVGNVAGNLGMLFGLSLYGLVFDPISRADTRRQLGFYKETSQIVLLTTAFSWTLSRHNKFNQFLIRQETVSKEKDLDNHKAQSIYLTLCPVFNDWQFLPAKGFDRRELTFLKFSLLQQRNILSMNFSYNGKWSTKWKFNRHNVLQAQVFGQQCYTYQPRLDETAKIDIELNIEDVVELKGYIHQHDSLQHAFMHKSSEPKFSLSLNNHFFPDMPNHYLFLVKAKSVLENRDVNCVEFVKLSTDCFVKHLEKVLQCQLPWDGSRNESCPRCQFPFVYNGIEYWNCTNTDARLFWCATAVTRTGAAIRNAWQICDLNSTLTNNAECLHENDAKFCSSRESLELLVNEFLDVTKTNPRIIAEDLHNKIGCPFSCHYQEYSSELMLKKHDVTMKANHLRLLFDVINEDTGSERDVKKDLDYDLDMLMSDLGNGFGFLLGLSLITVIKQFLGSAKSLLSRWRCQSTVSDPSLTYIFVKWMVVTGFVSWIVIVSIFGDTSEELWSLHNFQSTAESNFLSIEDQSLKFGFLKQDSNITCPYQSDIGDGYCDDNVNVEECDFDGGDCCRPVNENKPNAHWFCSRCSCHKNMSQDTSRVLKPGLCEFCVFPFLNNQFMDPSIEEIADDCVNLADLPGKSFCPTAVKEDNTPFGIPYQWSCPVSDHQLHPSCYESPDNVWICNDLIEPGEATSSTPIRDDEFRSAHAINGDKITLHGTDTDSFFMSREEHYPWLQIHFVRNVTIHKVAITDRFSNDKNRNLTVTVGFSSMSTMDGISSNPLCGFYEGPTRRGGSVVMKCKQPLTGNYLVIQQVTPNEKYHLRINEVYVCGS